MGGFTGSPNPALAVKGGTGAAGGASSTPPVPGGSVPAANVPNVFNQALSSLGQGMSTGYLPANLQAIEAGLRPSLESSFERGAAALREQNALTGNLSSTGSMQQITDYRSQLENQLGSNLAGIYGGALPSAIGAQSSLTGLGTQLPGSVLSWLQPSIGAGMQSAQYNQMLPYNIMSSMFGGATNMPFYQPTYGQSKGQSALGAGTTLGSAYLGGK